MSSVISNIEVARAYAIMADLYRQHSGYDFPEGAKTRREAVRLMQDRAAHYAEMHKRFGPEVNYE